MINNILGIQFTDKVRYVVIDETKKKHIRGQAITSDVTEYEIQGTASTPPLIIIDTPGFGDNRG